MVIWVRITASLYLSVPKPKPGLITIISHGMAACEIRVRPTVKAAMVAMASAASLSATSAPSRSRVLE